jgi:hypothetical protein
MKNELNENLGGLDYGHGANRIYVVAMQRKAFQR